MLGEISVKTADAEVPLTATRGCDSGAPPSTDSVTLPVGVVPGVLTVTVTTPFALNVTVGAVIDVVVTGLRLTVVVAVPVLFALLGSEANEAVALSVRIVPPARAGFVATVSV